jgi:hypothetical protein
MSKQNFEDVGGVGNGDLKWIACECGLASYGSRQEPVAGCCEEGNESPDSILGAEFLDEQRYYIRRKNSQLCGCVVREMACVDMGVSDSESCDVADVGIAVLNPRTGLRHNSFLDTGSGSWGVICEKERSVLFKDAASG